MRSGWTWLVAVLGACQTAPAEHSTTQAATGDLCKATMPQVLLWKGEAVPRATGAELWTVHPTGPTGSTGATAQAQEPLYFAALVDTDAARIKAAYFVPAAKLASFAGPLIEAGIVVGGGGGPPVGPCDDQGWKGDECARAVVANATIVFEAPIAATARAATCK